jgi:NADH-quinone oxidoreductase subunit N
MITYINLYIQDKYYGILYYLFSGIFTALFILSIGYIYIGYNIGYSILSIVFIWKLGLGPFHILMPKIYNSLSPKKILLIDIMVKYLLFYIFYKLLISIPININFIIITSMIIGTISTLKENNLLNILVYSSLVNYGLILILINNIELYLLYLMYYTMMVIIFIYLIVHINLDYGIDNPYYIFIWFVLIFNLIGIPPLAGFWIKMYAIYALVLNKLYIILAITIISLIFITSIYLKILLRFMINQRYIKYTNNNVYNSHILSTIVINLIYPLII